MFFGASGYDGGGWNKVVSCDMVYVFCSKVEASGLELIGGGSL